MSVKFKETVETNTRDQGPNGNSSGRDFDYGRTDYRERDSQSRREFDGQRSGSDQRERYEGSRGRERDYSYKERESRTERDGRGGRNEDYGFKDKDELKREKHDHSGMGHRFGEAVTKGEGAGGYLQVRVPERGAHNGSLI